MRKHVLTVLLMGVLAFGAGNAAYGFELDKEPDVLIPLRGVTSSVPGDRWDYGYLTGNGRMGAVVYGQPEAETIVFNHERLYLPQRRPEIPDLGKHLPEVRRLICEEGHVAARDFSIQRAAEQGHFNYHSDPFHLAFELKLEMPAKGAVTNYLRTTDFQTGEVSVRWSDEDGTYLRRLFVSRPDNVAVLSIARPDARRLNLTIAAPPITHELIRSARHVETDWVTYQNAYEHSPGGYDSVVRVITEGGRAQSEGQRIVISDADQVLLLIGIEWYETREEGSVEAIKRALYSLPGDYHALLRPHAAEHGEMFDRVNLDLGGGDDRSLTTEELLERAKATEYRRVPPALLEKIYDASRFYFLCSAGQLPPNLQGIWNGVFTAPWNGSYTFDTNVQNAMDSALSANMLEGMEGYFQLIESLVPDWRINAQKLFGARGILSQIVASPNTGLHLTYRGSWAWQFWTAGAGWLASYFYDYYLFTGDRAFLAERAVPLMKEVATFYEDFLVEVDDRGHYLYRPSISPETGSLLLSDNSTIDVAIAKELLTNLIAACDELEIERENVEKWRAMLDKMPPYEVGPDGDLAEWADGTFRHAYNHRHYSPFYPVFRSFEFCPEATPELWRAAEVALEKKAQQWLRNPGADWAGIPFGRAFHAQSAAYLGQGGVVEEIVNRMADRVYPSLHMSLRPDGHIFNFDGNGAFPDIVNRSLAFSRQGTLDLLRAVPPSWTKGSIRGILVRGQIEINHLQWDQSAGIVDLELTSGVGREITLRLPGWEALESVEVVAGAAEVHESPRGANARQIVLPAKERVGLRIRGIDL